MVFPFGRLRQWPRRRLALLALTLGAALAYSAYHFWDWYRFERRFQAARAALERHQFHEAKKLLDECALVRPDHGDVYVYLARAARRSVDFADKPAQAKAAIDEARRNMVQAERASAAPELTDLERRLFQFQFGQGERHEKALWDLVRQEHPDTTAILEALAKGYRIRLDLTRALDCTKLIVDHDPGHFPAWFVRGQTLEQLGLIGDAVPCYEKALELTPDDDKLRERLAQLLLGQGEPAQTLAHLEHLSPSRRRGTLPALLRAHAHLLLGEIERGRAALGETGEDPKKSALAAYLQGFSFLLESRHADAEPWFRHALALDASAPGALHGLIQCVNVAGKKEEAAALTAKVDAMTARAQTVKKLRADIVARPDAIEPRLQLGEMTLNDPGKGPEGAAWLQSVLFLDPRHARARALLAGHYRRLGHLAQAEKLERGGD